jgi:hypothetical protein
MNLARLGSRLVRVALLATIAAIVSGCVAGVGSPMASVPFDSAGRCGEYCSKMGLGLGAVVVMANTVGCVCTPLGRPAGSAAIEGAGAAAGMATLLAQQQEQQQAAAAAARAH